jgi:hypothetical protein
MLDGFRSSSTGFCSIPSSISRFIYNYSTFLLFCGWILLIGLWFVAFCSSTNGSSRKKFRGGYELWEFPETISNIHIDKVSKNQKSIWITLAKYTRTILFAYSQQLMDSRQVSLLAPWCQSSVLSIHGCQVTTSTSIIPSSLSFFDVSTSTNSTIKCKNYTVNGT